MARPCEACVAGNCGQHSVEERNASQKTAAKERRRRRQQEGRLNGSGRSASGRKSRKAVNATATGGSC